MVLQYWLIRGLLILGAAISVAAALFTSRIIGFPAPGVEHPSLLLQPSPVMAVVAALVVLVVGLICGSLVAGKVRPDAGLLAAAFGWLAITWTSGNVTQALFSAPTKDTYTKFAIETVLLGVFLAVGQAILISLRKSGYLKPDIARDGIELDRPNLPRIAMGIGGTALAYLLLTYLLVATPDKQQALLGCGVAAWIAAAAVHYSLEADLPIWASWSGVLLAAIAAYLYAGASDPGIPAIGKVAFPPARALPLDHASAGVIGALFGYWDARRWRRPNPATGPGSFVESSPAGA